MPELLMLKKSGVLWPASDDAAEALRGIKNGSIIKTKVTQPRNTRHHRLFFLLLKKVVENSDEYETTEALLIALKIALGHVNTIIGHDGQVYHVPKSIAFHKMDQIEFNQFYDRCVAVICKYFLPGVSDQELRKEVQSMIS